MVVKTALQFASPLVFTAIRMTLAAVILVLFFRKSIAQLTKSATVVGCGVGLLLFVGYALQTTGLKLTTPSKSAFLSSSSAVLVPLFLTLFWRIRIHPARIAGIMAAFAGLFLMTVPAGKGAIADFTKVNAGDLLTIVAAIAFAFQIIVVGRATHRFPFQQIVTVRIAFTALVMGVAVPLAERPQLQPSLVLISAIESEAAARSAPG